MTLGRSDASSDGSKVGCTDGNVVGIEVDGLPLGCVDGDIDGTNEGGVEGVKLGLDEGSTDGESVGAHVPKFTLTVKVQLSCFDLLSIAVIVTSVSPTLNKLPLGIEAVAEGSGSQSSAAEIL